MESRIYSLICPTGYFYIGATTNSLKGRLYDHKKCSKQFPDRKVYKYYNSINWEGVQITELESFTINDRKEMLDKENKYIKDNITNPLCLNVNQALQTAEERLISQQQYRAENAEKIKEYHDVYNVLNADKKIAYSKQYALENAEKVKETRKKYYEANKEEIMEKTKIYIENHKEKIVAYKKQWVSENKERLQEENKQYRELNKEKIQENGVQYYQENRDVIREKQKAYVEANKEAIYAKQAEYRKKLQAETVVQCECGGSYKPCGKGKHEKTKRHMTSHINNQ